MQLMGKDARTADSRRRGAVWRWARSTVFSGAALFSACPPAPFTDAAQTDASNVDVLALYDDVAVGSPTCGDDEQLDTEFDKQFGIDCAAVRVAVDARRTSSEREAQARLVAYMRSTLRRCCVSREQLVARMRPVNHENPQTPTAPSDVARRDDRIAGMLLCDPLTREIATRSFIADHAECLNPNSDVAPTISATSGGAP